MSYMANIVPDNNSEIFTKITKEERENKFKYIRTLYNDVQLHRKSVHSTRLFTSSDK